MASSPYRPADRRTRRGVVGGVSRPKTPASELADLLADRAVSSASRLGRRMRISRAAEILHLGIRIAFVGECLADRFELGASA